MYHLTFKSMDQAESGGSGIVSRRITGQTGSEQVVLKIPNNKVREVVLLTPGSFLDLVVSFFILWFSLGRTCNR